MRMRAAQRVPPEHPGRVQVARVRELAGDLRDRVVARGTVSPTPTSSVDAVVVLDGAHRRRGPHRVEDLLVAGAAAEVARQRLADLVVARVGRRARAGRPPRRRAPACRSRTAPRPRRRTPPARGAALPSLASPSTVDDLVAVGLRGEDEARSRRACRRAAPSRSRTRPARTRSSSRAARAAPAGRRAGSRRPRRRHSCRSPLTSSVEILHARAHLSSARAVSTRERVAAVGGGPADVVDRASAAAPPARGSRRRPRAAPHEPRRRARPTRTPRAARRARGRPTSASEQTAITIAFRGPTFMNVCRAPLGRTCTATISSSGGERVLLRADAGTRCEREPALAADARQLDLRALDEQRRQRVARRRGGAEVAADRAAVADLRRADRPRRLRERRQQPPPAAARIASAYVRPAPSRACRSRATSRAARRPRSG